MQNSKIAEQNPQWYEFPSWAKSQIDSSASILHFILSQFSFIRNLFLKEFFLFEMLSALDFVLSGFCLSSFCTFEKVMLHRNSVKSIGLNLFKPKIRLTIRPGLAGTVPVLRPCPGVPAGWWKCCGFLFLCEDYSKIRKNRGSLECRPFFLRSP